MKELENDIGFCAVLSAKEKEEMQSYLANNEEVWVTAFQGIDEDSAFLTLILNSHVKPGTFAVSYRKWLSK